MILNPVSSIKTRNPEAMREVLFKTYGATKFDSSGREDFRAEASYIRMTNVSLGYCAYGAKTSVEFPEAEFVRLQMAVKGKAATEIRGRSTAVTTGQSCITPANCHNRIDFGRDFAQHIVRVSTEALNRKMTLLLGFKPRKPLLFTEELSSANPHDLQLRRLLSFLGEQAASDTASLPASFLREMESAIIVGFLSMIPHSLSETLETQSTDTPDVYVRRVEEYIEASWDQPLTITKLSQVTGIGVRSIFYAFKRSRGYTPLEFVKMIRLKKAQEMLCLPSSDVTSVAFRCGFGNLGHFSRDYKQTFGELPSDTLRRTNYWPVKNKA